MCYCPECAKEDRKLYGETYWHILPQINGVEYCPLHKCRIVESQVKASSIKYHLIAANPVIGFRFQQDLPVHDHQTKQNYMELAEDSEWMMRKGTLIDCDKASDLIAKDVAKHIYSLSPRKATIYNGAIIEYIKHSVEKSVSKRFLDDLKALYEIGDGATYSWKFMLNCYVVRLVQIRCRYGGVENFYQKLSSQYDATSLEL